MGLNAALTGSEQTALNNGQSTRRTWLSVASNTVVATATVATTPTAPIRTLSVSGTSGGWANIVSGQTVKITDSTGLVLRGWYRVWGADPTHLVIGAVGLADPGLLNADIRTSGIIATDIVTIYNRFDVWAVAPRIDYTNPTTFVIYEDFDQSMTIQNTHPGPALQITCNGHPGHFASFTDTGQTYSTVVLLATPVAWPSTVLPYTYSWIIPAGVTVIGGSISTSTVTVQVPAAPFNFVIQLTVTDSAGGASVAHRNLWCHDVFGNAPILISQVTSDVANRTGCKLSLDLMANKLASIPDGAMVHIWDSATWGGSTNATFSFSDHFTGWLLKEKRHTEGGLRQASVDIVGPAGLMEMLSASSQYFQVATAPATWQQIISGLSYLDFIIYWMVLHRTTLAQLFDWIPLGTTTAASTGMPAWDIPNGSLLAQCQALATRYGANFGCDRAGQFVIAQHPSLVAYVNRGTLVTRDSINSGGSGTGWYQNIDINRELHPRVRRLRGEGFAWDGSSMLPVALIAEAPGNEPGQGATDDTFQSQLVITQASLNTRTGLELARRNNLWPSVRMTIPYNRAVYEPAHMQFVNVTDAANLSPDGLIWQRNIVPTQVTKNYLGGGSTDMVLEGETETAALDAVTIGTPPAAFVGSAPPQIAPFTGWGSANTSTPITSVGLLLATSDTKVARGTSWVDLSPQLSIFPASAAGTTIKLIQDPWNYKRLILFSSLTIAICDDCTVTPAVWRNVPLFQFGAGNALIGDIQGSINRKGYFGWLSTDATLTNVYYNYTTDYFQTQQVTTVSTYNTNQVFSIGMGSFSGATLGIVLVSAGTAVYWSSNWGATFATYGVSLNIHGGMLIIPYSVGGGGGNGGVSFIAFIILGDTAGLLQGRATNGTTHGISGASGTGLSNIQQMCSYALDGNIFYISYGGILWATTDGGITWAGTAIPTGAGRNCVSTWPTNSAFLIAAENSFLRYSVNSGAAWTDIWTGNYDTFRAGAYGVNGKNIVSVFGDLLQQYPVPVTQ